MKKIIGYILLILFILAITFGFWTIFYFGADLSVVQSILCVLVTYITTAVLTGILWLIAHLIS